MKKGITFILILLLISMGTFVYYIQSDSNIENTEAYTPWWFWTLAPKVRLMARTVSAEARGEPFVGQVAVAAVIMNRVDSPKFPDTIGGVIYQPWAFTAVMYGHIWNHAPSYKTIRATLAAYRGWDPTYGSLYYYNPAGVTSMWIYSRDVVRRIGKHIFAY
ncbi:Cell Wall Hydrolase [Halobacteroides halobius DSM 5150]|uniref:Cell Wall Hydrolase n=1 Tax=Halobacteroides halobius (strain ATCC 35273 / DSM 5150 / MD-1) TaxID=748449 RepID=L0KB38_HALHC|nr:cell wall hydrolase [Halobacteroides halobius]AGB42231.1 Cell Wall Hydrolase [Halobacteroides halobius DSM 5150]